MQSDVNLAMISRAKTRSLGLTADYDAQLDAPCFSASAQLAKAILRAPYFDLTRGPDLAAFMYKIMLATYTDGLLDILDLPACHEVLHKRSTPYLELLSVTRLAASKLNSVVIC